MLALPSLNAVKAPRLLFLAFGAEGFRANRRFFHLGRSGGLVVRMTALWGERWLFPRGEVENKKDGTN